jgi:hypothetical protein
MHHALEELESSSSSSRKREKTLHKDVYNLARELHAFAAYISMDDTERDVREGLIQVGIRRTPYTPPSPSSSPSLSP